MPVEQAEKIIATLERKREACLRTGVELQDERTALAYSAHADSDAKAKNRLEEVHALIATHASELANLDAALRAACERVVKAREHEATHRITERIRNSRAGNVEYWPGRGFSRISATLSITSMSAIVANVAVATVIRPDQYWGLA